MSIEQTETVDFHYIDKATDEAVLAITDHLEWKDSDKEHAFLLQEKINSYLRFVEGGQLLEEFPGAANRVVRIDVIAKYPLSELGLQLVSFARNIIENAGFRLRVVVNPDE